MSFNIKQLGPYRVVKENYLLQGKDTELLCENNYNNVKQYYSLGNYTGFIDNIQPSPKKEGMSEISLVFNNGERATTQAFVDDPNIREKTFVSVIGYVVKRNNEYQLFCRGITPIYTNIDELLNADLNKYVKVDLIINLSDIKESTVYYETDKIYRLQGTDYYYTEKIDRQAKLKQYFSRLQEKKQEKEEQKETKTTEEQAKEIEPTVEETTDNATENMVNDLIKDIIQ